jgi:TusE/DsrC/DsvC family sulfur relay protein
MPAVEFQGQKIELSDEGFMVHPDEWNEEIAMFLAADQENLNFLTAEHWAVIRFIREYYLEKKLAPMVRSICKSTNLQLRQIYELFPSGPAKGACKLAGLPKPDGCV